MDYLDEAKQIMGGYSGRASDLDCARAYAAIALVEAMHDITRKLALINSKLDALLGQGQGQDKAAEAEADVAKAETSAVKPKATQRKTSQKQ